jgi:hypothetical protein
MALTCRFDSARSEKVGRWVKEGTQKEGTLVEKEGTQVAFVPFRPIHL